MAVTLFSILRGLQETKSYQKDTELPLIHLRAALEIHSWISLVAE